MKLLTCLLLVVALFGVVPVAWAGPAEEIAELGRQRARASTENNAEAFTAAFADNAVVTPFWAPFRVKGKAAIKDHFTTLFQTWPTRQAFSRQPSVRVYGNDTTVVTTSYSIQIWTDRAGKTTTQYVRTSVTWVKLGAEWWIVDSHASLVPMP